MSPKAQLYFTEARGTLALALPIIAGQLGQVLMGVTDSYMVSQVGKIPFAASAFAGNIFNLFFIFGIGLLLAVPVLVARAHGEGRPRECGEFMRHGIVLATALSVLEIVLLLIVSFQLHRFAQPPEVVAETAVYFRIVTVSLLPVLLFQVMRQYSEAMGRPWAPMMLLLACVGLNVGLNWVLIFGHLGAPALGLVGAGWATLISRVVAIVVLFWWLKRDAPEMDGRAAQAGASWPVRWIAPLERARVATMLRIGVPASGQLLFEGGAFCAAAVMMGWFGSPDPIAAHQVAINCASITFMFMLGLSSAAGIRVGQCAGAGNSDRLRPIGFGALGMCVLGMVFSGTVISLARYEIAEAFHLDASVTMLAAKLLMVAAIFQVFDGMQVVGAGMLRGLSDVRVPTAITFVAYWVIALPVGYFYGVRGSGGPVGVWIALAAGLAFAGVALTWRFARLTRA